MRKTTMLLIVISLMAILFCGLWLHETADQSDMEQLCQYYAAGAAGTLQEYEQIKEDYGQDHMSTYWYGASRFYAFMDTLQFLPDPGGWNEALYKSCQIVYDHMLHAPDEVLEHMDEVLAAMELIGEDYTSSEARRALSQLSYNMQCDVWEEA